jgi:Ca2+-binding RTX toxin-like protein
MSNIVHIASNAGPDLAAIINAALADPDVSTVILEAGIFVLHSPIFVPSNKTLLGSGRDHTIIRASPDFSIPDSQHNAVIVSEEHSSNITLSDFTVDAAKVSPDGLRLNGIFMRFSANFLVARIDVENATGYAHYAAGDLGAQLETGWVHGVPASGRYEDCNTFNSQVHFEQFFADGITLFNVHARDGDGDIPTEAYFHPIVGSRNITYEQSSAIGSGFLGFSLISSVLPLENISIIDTQIEILHPSQGSALISLGNLPVNGLFIENSSFIAHDYIAFRIGGVSGTASNSYFQGGAFALEVTTSGDGTPSHFVVTDSVALGVRDATYGFGVAGVHSDFASYLTWNGGSIEARAGLMFPVSGTATISATTLLIGTGHDVIATYTEGDSDLLLFSAANLGLAGMPDLNGATLRVGYLSHHSTLDALTLATLGLISRADDIILYDGNAIGTIAGGANGTALQITFNAMATLIMVEVLVDSIYFRNLSEAPFTTARLLVAGLQIVGGSYTEITASLSVVGVDDPAFAMADSGTAMENGAVLIDVLANELDPDGVLDIVASIDGMAIVQGGSVILASGARVSLTAQGQIVYDVNGAFSMLAAPSSGTSYTSETDSFTYTLAGGGSAVVEMLITGETSAEDILRGDSGANVLTAALAGQTLQGLAGKDRLSDNGMAVSIAGGLGNDQYYVENAATTVLELPDEGIDTVRTVLANFTLSTHIENLYFTGTNARFYGYGNAQNNIIDGGGLGDFLIGYLGNDTLHGGAGADVLDGGADHDTLDGGTGNDVMIGGGGNDIFYVDSVTDVVIEGADPGFDTVFASINNYILADWVENLSFSGVASYTGTGNAVSNQIQGSISDDTLFGLGGNDRLIGFGGDDTLKGGEGDDLLQGGEGSDHLTGGAGADQFRFDTSISYGDIDNIVDFELGADQIQLSRAVFSALNLGALSASAFVTGTAAHDSDDRIIYDAATGALYYDADGNGSGAAIKFASLAPLTPLDEGAFVII